MTGPEQNSLDELRKIGAQVGIPTGPTPEEAGVSLDSADDIVARLQARHGPLSSTSADPIKEPTPRARPRWLHPARGAAVLAAAAALAAVLAIQPWNSPSAVADEPPVLDFEYAAAGDIAFAPGRPAQDVLRDLSAAAATQPDPTAGPVQHIVTDNWFAELTATDSSQTSGSIIPTYRETWLRPDGSLVAIEHDGKPLSADGRTTPDVSRPTGVAVEELPPATADPSAATTLPGDPALTRQSLLQRGGCPDDTLDAAAAACLLQAVSDLHATNVVPPAASTAIWDALAEDEHIRTLGDVDDRLGREGIGITVEPGDGDFRVVLIVDADSGRLLGSETILIRALEDVDLEVPAIFSFTAYVATENVGLDEVPDGSEPQ